MRAKYMAKAMIVLMLVMFFGCSQENQTLKDGYYTAEMAEYHNGWKEFVTICVKSGDIVSVEYNAANESGFIKSWDMAYMRRMNGARGTYPNQYTREYARQVIEKQNAEEIDAISGASTSVKLFEKLIAAAMELSKTAKTEVTIVPAE